MVVIPAGTFWMGSTPEQVQQELDSVPSAHGIERVLALFGLSERQRAARFMAYEQPQHDVRVSKDFLMSRFPITRAQFGRFVRETGYQTGNCLMFPPSANRLLSVPNAWSHPSFEQTERDPVVCVSWLDAEAYIKWLNQKAALGRGGGDDAPYRLPSEAEWEYAARAGTSTQFWWGDDVGGDHAYCNGCNDPQVGPDGWIVFSRYGRTHQGTLSVGLFPPNPFGLFDMLGNVVQMTSDCWHDNYIGAPANEQPWMSGDCRRKAPRGGSWRGSPWASRAAIRSGADVNDGNFDRGFRIAKAASGTGGAR